MVGDVTEGDDLTVGDVLDVEDWTFVVVCGGGCEGFIFGDVMEEDFGDNWTFVDVRDDGG